jgi:hypothetical protein
MTRRTLGSHGLSGLHRHGFDNRRRAGHKDLILRDHHWRWRNDGVDRLGPRQRCPCQKRNTEGW